MTDLITAARAALTALEASMRTMDSVPSPPFPWEANVAAIAALRTAIAKAEAQPGAEYKRGYEEALNDCIRNGVQWARSMFANDAEHIKRAAEAQPAAPVAWGLGRGSIGLNGFVSARTKAANPLTYAQYDIPLYASPAAPPQVPEWLSRFHHLMKKHGLHPGRTDDDLLDILDAHLSAAPPQVPQPLSDEQMKKVMSAAGVRVFQPGLWDVLLDAGRAIERVHGIGAKP